MNVNNLWYKYGEINISACQRDEDENLLCHVCLSEEKKNIVISIGWSKKKIINSFILEMPQFLWSRKISIQIFGDSRV